MKRLPSYLIRNKRRRVVKSWGEKRWNHRKLPQYLIYNSKAVKIYPILHTRSGFFWIKLHSDMKTTRWTSILLSSIVFWLMWYVHDTLCSTVVQFSTAQYSTVQYSRVEDSTVECNRGQLRTVQHTTVEHSVSWTYHIDQNTIEERSIEVHLVVFISLCSFIQKNPLRVCKMG